MTDAQRIYAALGVLVDAASEAWDKQAYDEVWGSEYMLWAEITDWADEMRLRMSRAGYVREDGQQQTSGNDDISWEV